MDVLSITVSLIYAIISMLIWLGGIIEGDYRPGLIFLLTAPGFIFTVVYIIVSTGLFFYGLIWS